MVYSKLENQIFNRNVHNEDIPIKELAATGAETREVHRNWCLNPGTLGQALLPSEGPNRIQNSTRGAAVTSVSLPSMMIAEVAPKVFCLIFVALVIVVFLCCFWLRREGRRALQAHQDSLSESDLKGGRDLGRSRPKRIKIKKDSKKEKDKKIKGIPKKETQENPQWEEGDGKEKNRLYLVSTEFTDLDLSDDELSSQEEGELEEEAAKYEEERYERDYHRPPAYNPPGARSPMEGVSCPSAPPLGAQVTEPGKGCHYISQSTWARLASAYPVMEDSVTHHRWYEPVPYKQLKDLVTAVKDFGATADYPIALLRRLCTSVLTPTDWTELARACLTRGQFLDFKSLVADRAHTQARVNAQNGYHDWTADMLLGQGQFAGNQVGFPIEVYQQISDIHYRAWKALPNKGEVAGNLTKIIHGPVEPFAYFVGRMMEVADKTFGSSEHTLPFVQQIIFEQSTKECQRAIAPVRHKGLNAWIKACREIRGPLTNAGLAATMLSATKSSRDIKEKGVFAVANWGTLNETVPTAVGRQEEP
ncbi:igE-binding protein-like [Alexandromys fortis]|uniref:igE-binding protein-like n=1 Tax=Alexandromys fortis TaxID=100897 RepID=UPI0021539C28|nr:igE-binding protein-like [Microtus fortis]